MSSNGITYLPILFRDTVNIGPIVHLRRKISLPIPEQAIVPVGVLEVSVGMKIAVECQRKRANMSRCAISK
jgi:hypothetical protein